MKNHLIRQDSVSIPLAYDDCGGTGRPTPALKAGSTCVISASIVNNQAHSCKFVFPESKANVRGTMEIRGSGTPLINTDLR